MGLYIFKWLQKRWGILKSEKDFYYEMIGSYLALPIILLFLVPLGLIISIISGILQDFDWEMQIKQIFSMVTRISQQICFLLIIEFIIGVEIRQHHLKRDDKRRFRKIIPITIDVFLILFGIGIFVDAAFIPSISGNPPDILNSALVKLIISLIYAILIYLPTESYFDSTAEPVFIGERKILENQFNSLTSKINILSSLSDKEYLGLMNDFKTFEAKLIQFEEKYFPNEEGSLDSE